MFAEKLFTYSYTKIKGIFEPCFTSVFTIFSTMHLTYSITDLISSDNKRKERKCFNLSSNKIYINFLVEGWSISGKKKQTSLGHLERCRCTVYICLTKVTANRTHSCYWPDVLSFHCTRRKII